MTDPTWPATIEPKWFVPVFVALWFGIAGLLAHLSGWATLAERFRSPAPIDGDRFSFVSGSLGRRWFPVSYNHCLFVTINTNGVRWSLFFLFRFLSPPLFVPWTAVESIVQKRILFIRFTTVVLRGTWPRLTLQGGAAEALYRTCTTARPDLTHRG